MYFKLNIKEYFIIVSTILFFAECANPVSPTGGAKDETPPEFVISDPPNFSRNFQSTKARIYFNEFIQLKDLTQQLIISPPMDEKPEIKLKGKSVVIEFKEKLKDSTTYNIFFGDAIVDLTEGNPATNFQYVFSTGNILDSLTFKGNVKDAFNLEPVKDLNVMLYLDNSDTIPFDSLPYFIKPYYNTKTSESGDFQFNNLPGADFKILVLEDANSNMLFDQVTERIAFLDSLIKPYYIPPPVIPDTALKIDSLAPETVVSDTTIEDISLPPLPLARAPDPVNLYLFMEHDSIQRFIKASLVKEGKLMFVFKTSTVSPEIRALNINDSIDWKIIETNESHDTINFWFKKDMPDTLIFSIADNNVILDTVSVSTVVKSRGRKNKDKEEKPEKLIVKFSSKMEINKTLKARFNYPVKNYDLSGAMMTENNDTLFPEFRLRDSLGLQGEIYHKWLEKSSYTFMIPDSAFTGILDQSHDTLRHKLTTRALEDYGNLYINLTLSEPGVNHIIQLLKDDKIVSEYNSNEDTKLSFMYLLPGNYIIKAIIDRNNNKKWDTGHYMLGIHPEEVYYFPSEITARANWDIIEDWTL